MAVQDPKLSNLRMDRTAANMDYVFDGDFSQFLKHERYLRSRSTPANQFKGQVRRLFDELMESREQCRSQLSKPLAYDAKADKAISDKLTKYAEETIGAHWQQQGIWDTDWGRLPDSNARWMHEDDDDWWSAIPVKPERNRPYIETPKISAEEQDIAKIERQPLHIQPTDHSRPYRQFIYQVSKERERLIAETAHRPTDCIDINSIAYNNVRDFWEGEGIWNNRWETLPGMEWKHEIPDQEFRRWIEDEWRQIMDEHNQKDKKPRALQPTTTRPIRGILKAPVQQPPPPKPRAPTRTNLTSLQQTLQEKSNRLGLVSTGSKTLPLNEELRGHTRPGEQSIQEALMKKVKRLGLSLMGRISLNKPPSSQPAGGTNLTLEQYFSEKERRPTGGTTKVTTSLFDPPSEKGSTTRLFPSENAGRATRSRAKATTQDLTEFPEALAKSPETQFPSPGHHGKRKVEWGVLPGQETGEQRTRRRLGREINFT